MQSAAPMVSIDRDGKMVLGRNGEKQGFSSLVLAVGSSAFVPEIVAIEKEGVFTFRDLKDAIALQARQASARNVVIIGGGLPGLEAARAMRVYGTQVSIVEHNSHLMNQQLDAEAGELLKQHMESLQISVWTNNHVRKIHGNRRVEEVELRGHVRIPCDTSIYTIGDCAEQRAFAGGNTAKAICLSLAESSIQSQR